MKTLKSLCLAAGLLAAISSCKKNESPNSTAPQSEKKMQLSSVGKIFFPSETFKEIDPKSVEETLERFHMTKKDDKTYTMKFPVKGFTIVLSNGKTIEPTSEGDLFLTEADFKSLSNSFQLKVKGNLIPATEYRYSAEEQTLIFESTIQDYLAKKRDTDCHKEKKSNHPTLSGYKNMGRCLDYNGQFSDGGNYPHSDRRAWTNFVGSDCYYAMSWGYCWSELKNPGCYETHGGRSCSSILGCPDYYHTHSTLRAAELFAKPPYRN